MEIQLLPLRYPYTRFDSYGRPFVEAAHTGGLEKYPNLSSFPILEGHHKADTRSKKSPFYHDTAHIQDVALHLIWCGLTKELQVGTT